MEELRAVFTEIKEKVIACNNELSKMTHRKVLNVFICGLFNDAVSSSDYPASNYRTNSK
jgi:hypothetical protein